MLCKSVSKTRVPVCICLLCSVIVITTVMSGYLHSCYEMTKVGVSGDRLSEGTIMGFKITPEEKEVRKSVVKGHKNKKTSTQNKKLGESQHGNSQTDDSDVSTSGRNNLHNTENNTSSWNASTGHSNSTHLTEQTKGTAILPSNAQYLVSDPLPSFMPKQRPFDRTIYDIMALVWLD